MSGEALGPTLLASCMAVSVASLLGSIHCAGMCGGLSACATPLGMMGGSHGSSKAGSMSTSKPVELTTSIGQNRRVGPSLFSMQASYHVARLVGYAALGLLAGTVGAALDLGGSMVGVQRVASLIAGATIALIGAVMLLRIAGVRIPHLPMPGPISRLFAATQRRAMGWPPVVRAIALGGVTPLLPCGWLYAFVAIAAGAGSAFGGAAVMAAFWVGTVPALVAVAVGVRLAVRLGATRLGRALPAVAALLMIAVGLHLAVVRGGKAAIVASSVHPVGNELNEALGTGTASASHPTPSGERMENAIEAVDDALPACCRGEAEP